MQTTRSRSATLPGSIITAGLIIGLLAACVSSEKKRTPGTFIDDQTIEVQVIDRIYDLVEFNNEDHIKIEVQNGTVLLAGETQSESNKALATTTAKSVRGVDKVVNELAVQPPASAGNRLNNSYISAKANSILTAKNPVEGVDASRIKVMTARKIVYLMGTVTREEGDRVAEVVSNIGGVEKVVKVFDYID